MHLPLPSPTYRPVRLRVVCTSRPEGVRLSDFSARFVVFGVKPLAAEQQRETMRTRLHGFPVALEIASHLASLAAIRQSHDALYHAGFTPSERTLIEGFQVPNRLFLNGRAGLLDPGMRLKGPDGVSCARMRVVFGAGSTSIHSSHLKGLSDLVTMEVLAAIDALLDGVSEYAVTEKKVMVTFEAAVRQAIGQEGEREEVSPPAIRLSELARLNIKSTDATGEPLTQAEVRTLTDLIASEKDDLKNLDAWRHTKHAGDVCLILARLVLRRRRVLLKLRTPAHLLKQHEALKAAAPHTTASELWPCILGRTDQIYDVAEELVPIFQEVVSALGAHVGIDASALTFASDLKDPVSVHEWAMDEASTLFADFASGQAVAEACTLDLVRARAVCPSSASMIRLLERLREGFGLEVESGSPAHLSIVRCTNQFAGGALHVPTRFRHVTVNLLLEYDGRRTFCELQVHHAQLLGFHEGSTSDEAYAFFRALQLVCWPSSDATEEEDDDDDERSLPPPPDGAAVDASLERTLTFLVGASENPMQLSALGHVLKHREHHSLRSGRHWLRVEESAAVAGTAAERGVPLICLALSERVAKRAGTTKFALEFSGDEYKEFKVEGPVHAWREYYKSSNMRPLAAAC